MRIKEGDPTKDMPLEAAKWLQIPMLLDKGELETLFSELGTFWICISGRLIKKGEECIKREDFLSDYGEYIHAIQVGKEPDMMRFRRVFSSIITCDLEALFKARLSETEEIVKPKAPIIQLQAHTLTYSRDEKKFRSMLFGKSSISWGILFSYPQLMQDPETKQILRVDASDRFPNTVLFKKLMKWQRKNTIPTPFFVGERQIKSSARIGKACFKWINNHRDLKRQGLSVVTKKELDA